MSFAIKGFQANTLIDWEGKLASTIFLAGCNLRCPFCHASDLIVHPEKLPTIPFIRIESFLRQKKSWLDGVVICGGEPTIHIDLPALIAKIRALGLLVKLDTNGTRPELLAELLEKKMLDYVAMDIKSALTAERYSEACGTRVDMEAVEKSIGLLLSGRVDYEFRTTVVPGLVRKGDVLEIARRLTGGRRYILQQFQPRDTLEARMLTVVPYPEEEVAEMARLACEHLPTVYRRG